MECGVLNKKGQISIEFMLLTVIILLYIHTVVNPTMTVATDAAMDVSKIGEARIAAEKIANTVNYIASLPADAKQTIHVFVPKDVGVLCESNQIKFEVELSSPVETEGCDGTGKCIKTFALNTGITCNTYKLKEQKVNEVVIEKRSGTITLT